MLPPAGATESTHAHIWFLGFIKNERCVTLLLKQQERETKEKKGGIFTAEEEKEKSKWWRAESSGRPLPPSEGVAPLVRHHAVDLVDGGGEGAQAHLLRPVDDLRARLRPLLGHLQVLVGVDQEVKGTWAEGTVVQVTAFAGRTGGGGNCGNSQGVSSSGRKVTVAVICLMTERISSWMVLMDFSLGALGTTPQPSQCPLTRPPRSTAGWGASTGPSPTQKHPASPPLPPRHGRGEGTSFKPAEKGGEEEG